MSKRNFFILVAVVGIILIAVVIFTQRPPTTESAKRKPAAPADSAVATGRSGGEDESDLRSKVVRPPTAQGKTSQAPALQVKPVRLHATQVLASVNGRPILGKDLLVFDATNPNAEQTLSPDMYKFLLDRAIDRELTFQAANSHRIELTAAQQDQLDRIRKNLFRDENTEDGKVVRRLNSAGTEEDQIAFHVRDFSAFVLQSSLLAETGAPSPFVDEAVVEEHYKNHVAQYGALPSDPTERAAAWKKIDAQIRAELYTPTALAFEERRRQYLDQLRNSSSITVNEPTS